MPGFGVVLGATFLANTAGNVTVFDTVDRLASVAGLAPSPRDSGRISGNHHRPHRFNRRLLRTCYLAALSSLKASPASQGVLRPQTRRRQVPQAGDHRPRPTPAQHDLGHDP